MWDASTDIIVDLAVINFTVIPTVIIVYSFALVRIVTVFGGVVNRRIITR
jgi:hypothetical protein